MLKWKRWERYEQSDDGWISPAGEPVKPYIFSEFDDLAAHLARVNRSATPNIALLDFYSAFGLLGQTVLSGEPILRKSGTQRSLKDGDQQAWALLHAQNVDLILSLLRERWAKLDRLISLVLNRAALQVPLSEEPWQKGIPAEDLHKLIDGADALEQSRLLVAQLLNPNLKGIPRRFDPDTGASEFHFSAPVQIIYWQLADHAGIDKPRRCMCGALFFALHANQKFCPPTPGQKSSRCAARFRQRRKRRGERRLKRNS